MQFQHPLYQSFFEQLLCDSGEALSIYADLFDFRPTLLKRNDFNKIRNARYKELIENHGKVCMLKYAPDCDVSSGLCVDHLIPISSSKLNKQLLGATTSRDANGKLKKAPTQSFGSNEHRNLILACTNCNSLKQNRFIDKATIQRALRFFS